MVSDQVARLKKASDGPGGHSSAAAARSLGARERPRSFVLNFVSADSRDLAEVAGNTVQQPRLGLFLEFHKNTF
jgi:hypothetical protein